VARERVQVAVAVAGLAVVEAVSEAGELEESAAVAAEVLEALAVLEAVWRVQAARAPRLESG
jgi:hypothetical protein